MKKHTWVSNAAFARLTGYAAVCLHCGAPKTDLTNRACPGHRIADCKTGCCRPRTP